MKGSLKQSLGEISPIEFIYQDQQGSRLPIHSGGVWTPTLFGKEHNNVLTLHTSSLVHSLMK